MTEKIAIFAAGCFWGVEEAFRKVSGVLDTEVGYTGGHKEHPTYKEVCTGQTGHAEAIKVRYDEDVVSYDELLEIFFDIHNPTTVNRQGPDVGTQYRSAIFVVDNEQEQEAKEKINQLESSSRFVNPIVTKIGKAQDFWPAEDYHQRYFEKRGGGTCRI